MASRLRPSSMYQRAMYVRIAFARNRSPTCTHVSMPLKNCATSPRSRRLRYSASSRM